MKYLIINHIVALLYAYFALTFHLKNVFIFFNEKYSKDFDKESIQGIEEAERNQLSASFFFFLSALIAAEFIFLDWISRSITVGIPGAVISTGIHIPIALLLSGLLLRPVKIEADDKKKILFLVTLTVSIAFLFWNWRLGLLSLAIVLGKYIWIDFAIDFKFSETWDEIKRRLKEPSIESTTAYYCKVYLSKFMIFQLMVFLNAFFDRSRWELILYYLSPFILIGMSLWVVRMNVKK